MPGRKSSRVIKTRLKEAKRAEGRVLGILPSLHDRGTFRKYRSSRLLEQDEGTELQEDKISNSSTGKALGEAALSDIRSSCDWFRHGEKYHKWTERLNGNMLGYHRRVSDRISSSI
ncbi:hypothetical protein WAI453_001203 [Rhynchosporium graminicola]